MPSRTLHFPHPPRSFVAVDGVTTVWDAVERKRFGIYLWCFEIDGAHWVNYVGKTSSSAGFDGRLWTELKDWQAGRYLPPPVVLDEFLCGRRTTLPARPKGHFAREIELLVPRCRLLMAPLENKDDCLLLEGAIVNRLRRHGRTFQFLADRDKDRGYKRGRDVELDVVST
ncbi:MAG: hypothetical protein SGJ09_14690 [Phycisphaerae bacterium]|nr:hypothetical protein [Phycisphaerae bacterium]